MKKFFKNYSVILCLMLAYFAVNFDKSLMSIAAVPIAAQFHFSKTQIGLLMSAYSLGYAIVSFPGGWLSDKFGYKRVILISMAVATVTAIFFPLASILTLLILIRFIMGFAHGSVPSGTTKAIAMNYEKDRRVIIQSFWYVAQNIAAFAATYIGARIIAVNYQYAYFAAAALYVVTVLLLIKLLPDIRASRSEKKTDVSAKASDRVSLRELFRDKNIWIFMLSIFTFNLVLNGSNNWYATFLHSRYNISIVQIGTILSLSSLVSIACSPLTGWLLSKPFKNRENWFVFLSAVATAVLYVGVVSGNSLTLSIVCIYIAAYTAMFPFVTIKTLPHRLIAERNIGSAMGVITAISSLGGFVAPTLLGYITDFSSGSFTYAYYCLAGVIIIGGLICLFGLKTQKAPDKA